MTDLIYFDTDCISSFLWVDVQQLLASLYSGRIIISSEVYKELSNVTVPHLKKRLDSLIVNNHAKIESIEVGTETYDLFYRLTRSPDPGRRYIGDGEASSIALAKYNDGIVASNNFRDINQYIEELNLKHMTTGDILIDALKQGYITEDKGNQIWSAILSKRQRIGATTFTDYINTKKL